MASLAVTLHRRREASMVWWIRSAGPKSLSVPVRSSQIPSGCACSCWMRETQGENRIIHRASASRAIESRCGSCSTCLTCAWSARACASVMPGLIPRCAAATETARTICRLAMVRMMTTERRRELGGRHKGTEARRHEVKVDVLSLASSDSSPSCPRSFVPACLSLSSFPSSRRKTRSTGQLSSRTHKIVFTAPLQKNGFSDLPSVAMK